MKKLYMFSLILILSCILAACSQKENSKTTETDIAEEVNEEQDHDHDDHEGHDHEEDSVELDYKKLDEAIAKVLNEIPSFSVQSEIERGTNEDLANYFNADKMEFRLKVERVIGNQEYNSEELKAYAEYYVEENLLAIDIAKKKYNIEVTKSEVTSFIDDNVKAVVPEEKKLYANSIGVTLEELDNIFDRDIYIMDVLWSKLTPILMEKHPQAVGESEVEYMNRLTNDFYDV
ncbi:hypothetical protein [uncultured Psychrobacillus sp.]|uniref:hypothetical protein n=1 Tax=uncultured Psychrobacillus sp. TaxID=1551585 RepID=UPI00262CB7B0|nr:hypothetical protein [uncultured Psychrobacillus sp.]